MGHLVVPSILACDFGYVADAVKMCNQSDADWIHVDVMDGVFVPNISFGLPLVEAMKKHADIPLDVHLMIVEPEKYIMDFKKAGADRITIHIEACIHLHAAIEKIRSAGAKAGIAINPHTPVSALEEILPFIDLVCLMSVNPGFGGQKYISTTLAKSKKLKVLINDINADVLIEADGGVKLDNAQDVLDAGADILVSGSGIFSGSHPVETISKMKKLNSNTI